MFSRGCALFQGCVVQIVDLDNEQTIGTGCALSSAHVLTAYHVIADLKSPGTLRGDGVFATDLIWRDEEADV